MTDQDGLTEKEQPDEEVASEVPTTFATKGTGWSGREDDGPEVTELDT